MTDPDLYRQRLYALFADDEMLYPVFVDVRKGAPVPDFEALRREVAAQFELDASRLRIISHPRWATRRPGNEPHVVHLGMIPLPTGSEPTS